MAKSKQELLDEATALGLEATTKNTVAELQEMIKNTNGSPQTAAAPQEAEEAHDGDSQEDSTAQGQDAEEITAKAGKRSSKALKEVADQEAKEARKASGETAADKPKVPVKPARTRLERRGKHFRKNAEQIDSKKAYGVDQAIDLAQKTSHVKFDATVELHLNLNVDPRKADQNIRDNLVLPAGSGKKVRIAVLTDDAATAKAAGADLAGTDELFAAFDKGEVKFDILIASPNLMPKLGKYARMLGPKGLMPNPKSGTVTTDIDKAVAEAKAGRVEYRVDSTGIIHLGVGKVSFTPAQLQQNVQAVIASIKGNKPSSIKGNYFKTAHLTTSMGPSVNIDLANLN